MKARQLMTREVQSILPETPLAEAWQLMHALKVRHLPVTVEGKLVGLVSDRDFLGYVVRAKDGSLIFEGAVKAGQVMTLDPVACVQGAPVSELAEQMLTRQIDCVPIVNKERQLVGLVTSTDLMAMLLATREEVPLTFHVRPAVHA